LQDLHLFFKLDLLLGLVVSVLSFKLFKFTGILIFFSASEVHELNFQSFLLLKQGFDLLRIAVENFLSLSIEVVFNYVELISVVIAHVNKLLPHGLDQIINVIILLLEGFDVLLIFIFELRHKLLYKFILVIDDLLAGLFLNFNVLKR